MKEDTDKTWIEVHGGFARDMTLRDHFAATAMVGIVQCTGYATKKACKDAAECAYLIADAMLAAREAK